ncbi:vWA domain-containing protein [Sulfitobacter sp. JB4-11]|uniref:vWA domain-containing protein n=1 Tax=Sulfitobacter rhodophyticola TaxID=3238304 RepID=UPI003518156B
MTALPQGHSARAGPALRVLAETDPALAALSLWCLHRDGDSTRTQGSTITYGPEFEALARHEQVGLAAHHILHVALRHPARLREMQVRYGAGCDDDLYNLAADALVNEALLQADYALPRPAVTLSELATQALGQPVSAQAALAEWDVDRLYHALRKGTADQNGGRGDAARAYAQAQGFAGDIDAADGPADAAQEDQVEEAARWRQHLSRAMDAGRQAGRGIGRIGHRIADMPEPRTPWEVILRRTLARAVTVLPQPSHRRPARRWIAATAQAARAGSATPGFEPGQRLLSDVPRIVLAIDASGSIDDARLALFWAEVSGIARRLRAELHLLVFDDRIHHSVRIDPTQTGFPMPDLPRGGGTDFRPVLDEARRLQAAALVVLTDLEGDAGPPPKGLAVIWALPDAGTMTAPYGQLIDLSR